jgi:FixJ family two-component response regulator
MARERDPVFVLDDDPTGLLLVGRELSRLGHAVELFLSSANFFERIAARALCGCLLLDLFLADECGLAIQERLARQGCALPIIFMSGSADARHAARAMRSGAIDFLIKPVFPCELADAVDRALQLGRQQRERDLERGLAEQRLRTLTPREREVCMQVAAGRLNKQIAADLGASEKTIKVHRGRALAKLEVSSVVELVRLIDRAR